VIQAMFLAWIEFAVFCVVGTYCYQRRYGGAIHWRDAKDRNVLDGIKFGLFALVICPVWVIGFTTIQ